MAMNFFTTDLFDEQENQRRSIVSRSSNAGEQSVYNFKRSSQLNLSLKRDSNQFKSFGQAESRSNPPDNNGSISGIYFPDLPNANDEFDLRLFYQFEQPEMCLQLQPIHSEFNAPDNEKVRVRFNSQDSGQSRTRVSNNEAYRSLLSTVAKPRRSSRKPRNRRSEQQSTCCSCKKTRCLKLYCECFAALGT